MRMRSVAASSVDMALSKTQQRFNTQLAARKKTGAQYAAKRGARIVAGKGVEKVRFPVDGGPDRAAAGQAGGPFLIAGLLPLLVELSRVSQLTSSGFGMGPGPS